MDTGTSRQSPITRNADDRQDAEGDSAESSNSPPDNLKPGPVKRRRRIFPVFLVVLILAATSAGLITRTRNTSGVQGKAASATPPPVPVVAGVVEKRDVPIYLDGIGTAQAFNTVTVNARVDGEVKKVTFKEGQDVQSGDLLAQIDDAPYQAAYDQAVAKKGQDEAQLANARLNLTRDVDLFEKKAISTQERDTQQALVNQLDATVKADAAAITSAKVQLDYTKIVAPITGRTGIRLIDQGNIIHAADRTGVVVLTQLQPISLIFTLPEQDLGAIKQEMANTGKLTVLAVDRDSKTVLDEGELSVIDNQIDTTTGTIRLKATFPNAKYSLWPGQFVNARLLLTTRKDGLVVPASVVQRGPQGTFAFVINKDDSAAIRPITVGPIEQGRALIEKGLEAGERVVVDGQYKLQPGSRIKAEAARPPANQAATTP